VRIKHDDVVDNTPSPVGTDVSTVAPNTKVVM
jgi:hypothetical protein